jgi:PTS system nitrogen regulatory IIA component
MKLTVPEVARMFGATETTVERWIRDDRLPCEKVHGQYRFHRAELLEWANVHGLDLKVEPALVQRAVSPGPSLFDALVAGGVHRGLEASDRAGALRAVVERLPSVDSADRELVFEVFLARENLGSTGIGDGIAIPHVRNPMLLDVAEPSLTLCFLERPIEFVAIDGKPVHTLFAIVAPTARTHLALLARLAQALHDAEFRRALLARAPDPELLAHAHRIDVAAGVRVPPDEAEG